MACLSVIWKSYHSSSKENRNFRTNCWILTENNNNNKKTNKTKRHVMNTAHLHKEMKNAYQG